MNGRYYVIAESKWADLLAKHPSLQHTSTKSTILPDSAFVNAPYSIIELNHEEFMTLKTRWQSLVNGNRTICNILKPKAWLKSATQQSHEK